MIKLDNFRDKEGNLIVQELEIRQPLPNQLDGETAAMVALAGGVAAAAVSSSFSLNFLVNILMSGSMNSMLSSIKNLQVIVHLALYGVVVPAAAQVFFGYISELVAFDIISVSPDLVAAGSSLVEDETFELESNFVQLGYAGAFFVPNLGSLGYIIAVQFVLIPILVLLAKCQTRCTRVKAWSGKKVDRYFFNSLLTFLDGTFLVICLLALINISHVISGDIPANSSLLASILGLVICAAELVAVTIFLKVRYTKLDDDK